jgi:transcriptional pleiotropic regulator of transition state genes
MAAMLPLHRARAASACLLQRSDWNSLPAEHPYHQPVGAKPTINYGGYDLDTLMVRKIDDLGRVVVPAETRRLFNIHEGDELAITVENGGIVLRRLDAICVFCGSEDGVADFEGRGVCRPCREKISAL